MSIWDDPTLKPASSTFAKFVNPGDSVKGEIATIGKHVFPDGKAALQITFAEEDSPTLTAGQVVLASYLFALRPEVGETLEVTMTRIVPKGGKTLKEFYVAVTAADGKVRSQGETPAPF